MAQASRQIGVTELTYYRWRKEYGGLKADQANRRQVTAALAECPQLIPDQWDVLIKQAATMGGKQK